MTATALPRFDQHGALGWNDRALDGLNCVLRCVESVLRFRGLGQLAVARALNGALDPVGRDLANDFDGCRVDYRTAFDDGTRNLPYVLDRVTNGQPVMVLPDRFYLPGDVYEGRYHFHDHAMLAIDWSATESVLTVLDTDADPADGFRNHWRLDDTTSKLFTWIGTIEPIATPDERPAEEYLAERLQRDTALLGVGSGALGALFAELTETGLDLVSARALHILLLGDIQPQLFIYGHALAIDDAPLPPSLAEVRAVALEARGRAKRLGTGLIAAHETADPHAAYPRILQLSRPLLASLEQLHSALITAGGDLVEADPTAFDRLKARFDHIARTCFPLAINK